jgi:hypothetical protein
MGRYGGDRAGKYSQLPVEEQSMGSEERELGDGENESGSIYDKELPPKPARDHPPRAHDGTRRYRLLVGWTTTITLILSVIQFIALFQGNAGMSTMEETQTQSLDAHVSSVPKQTLERPCGTSAEEAKKAGCYFDAGLIAWLPRECYNEELDKSFRAANHSQFWGPNEDYTGPDTTNPLAVETVQGLPLRVADLDWPSHSWTTSMFHYAHCLHVWQYMHQALLKNKQLPIAVTRWSHTEHCSYDALMDTPKDDTYRMISLAAHNRYPKCIEANVMLGHDA